MGSKSKFEKWFFCETISCLQPSSFNYKNEERYREKVVAGPHIHFDLIPLKKVSLGMQ